MAAQRLAGRWDENSPPPLFKGGAQQLRKGERLGRKTLFLPLFNAVGESMLTGTRGDAPGPTGRALVDETSPGQTGRLPGYGSKWQRVPETRVPDGFYPIRRRVWKTFCTRGYVIGRILVPIGYAGTGVGVYYPYPHTRG